MINSDIISNPEILFEDEMLADKVTIDGYKIGDHIDSILNSNKITSAWNEECIVITEVLTETGKLLYKSETNDFSLEKRLELVKKHGGSIGYHADFGFLIKNNRIISFSLWGKSLELLESLTVNTLVKRIGKNTKTRELFDEFNGNFIEIVNLEKQILISSEDGFCVCIGYKEAI